MYDTSLGERVLRGAEARLFAGAAWRLTDDLRNWIPSKSGQPRNFGISNPLLDPLTAEQVIVLIDRVTAYLLEANVEAPTRTALLDATIATIYQQVTANIEAEIDSASPALSEYQELDERHHYDERTSVVAACYQTVDPDGEYCEIPDPDCEDMEIWQELIDRLRDRILPDQDWGLEAMAMDLPPQKSAVLKQSMGIQGDYFIDTVADASVEDAATAWCNMLERITGVRPEFWRFGAGIPMPEDASIPPHYGVLSFSDGPERLEDSEAKANEAGQTAPVLLSTVVEQLQLATDGWSSYLNTQTGEVIGLETDVFEFLEEGEDFDDYMGNGTPESLELAKNITESDDYLALPSQFDLHEWSIMRDFCETQSGSDRESLLNAVHGKGAFRFFKSTIRTLGLDGEWYQFRDQAIENIVIQWLESHAVEWTRIPPGETPF